MSMSICAHAPYCCITHRARQFWCAVCNTKALFPELHAPPSCPVAIVHPDPHVIHAMHAETRVYHPIPPSTSFYRPPIVPRHTVAHSDAECGGAVMLPAEPFTSAVIGAASCPSTCAPTCESRIVPSRQCQRANACVNTD